MSSELAVIFTQILDDMGAGSSEDYRTYHMAAVLVDAVERIYLTPPPIPQDDSVLY